MIIYIYIYIYIWNPYQCFYPSLYPCTFLVSLSFVLVFLSRKMKVVCPSAKSNLKYNDEGEKE